MKKLNFNYIPFAKHLANAAASGALEQLAATGGAALGGGGAAIFGSESTESSWFGLPVGNTAQRSSAVSGALRLNNETSFLEMYNDGNWRNVQYVGSSVSATGGNVFSDGAYTYHVFESSGDFVVSAVSPSSNNVDYLIVAGGGSGGGSNNGGYENGGGGGAGGYIERQNVSITTGTYTVIVGAGGVQVASGNPSSFNSNTAIGGGRGAWHTSSLNGAPGGSGGGGCGYSFRTAGSGTPGQGNPGGTGSPSSGSSSGGAGGGGAGGSGGSGSGNTSGAGGVGVPIAWVPDSYGTPGPNPGRYFCGGGGGSGGTIGAGGAGGGAPGKNAPGPAGINATQNTGGGGGSVNAPTFTVGSGGSGIVIIRYLTSSI